MPLSDAKVRSAKPAENPRKLYDERGLFLVVSPTGAKLWRLRFSWHGKEQTLSIGAYPTITLAQARQAREDAFEQLARGDDPRNPTGLPKDQATFEHVAREWLASTGKRREWSQDYIEAIKRRLELHAFGRLGSMPIHGITARHIRPVLLGIDDNEKPDTAFRLRSHICRVIRYAAGRGYVPDDRDPTATLRDVLTPVKKRKRPGLTKPEDVGGLILAIRGYSGTPVTRTALQLTALWFVRSAEIRHAKWEQFDLAKKLWRAPAEMMKSPRDHLVPLSRQALELLEQLAPLTERTGWLFPNHQYRRENRVMSENTLNAALRRLGFDTAAEHCAHGFRTTASTVLHELRVDRGWLREAVELQLAHVSRAKGSTEGDYNEAEYLPQRREIMQTWADHLDELAAWVQSRAGGRAAIREAIQD